MTRRGLRFLVEGWGNRRWAAATSALGFVALCGCWARDDVLIGGVQGDGGVLADPAGDAPVAEAQPDDADRAASCDDDNPCTDDRAGSAGCLFVAVAGSPACDDGDPCTGNDHCLHGDCKGSHTACDDGITCTWDRCRDGACTATHNQHWDCLPEVTLVEPPRALALGAPSGVLTIQGHVGPAKAALAAVRVNGVAVVVDSDGGFTVPWQLQHGANVLRVETVDVLGGVRRRTQGVRWATAWHPPGAPVPAGWLWPGSGPQAKQQAQEYAKAIAGASYQVPTLAPPPPDDAPSTRPQVPPATVLLHGAATPGPGGLWALSAAPAPLEVAVTAGAAAGIPASAACGGGAAAPALSGSEPWQALSTDLWNAALHAAWRGGALRGDVTPWIQPACEHLPCVAALDGETPWHLDACPGGAPRLRVTDLRIDVRVPGASFAATLYVAIDGEAQLSEGPSGTVLRLGGDVHVEVEVAALAAPWHETDVHAMLRQAAEASALPVLVARAQAGPLALWPH